MENVVLQDLTPSRARGQDSPAGGPDNSLSGCRKDKRYRPKPMTVSGIALFIPAAWNAARRAPGRAARLLRGQSKSCPPGENHNAANAARLNQRLRVEEGLSKFGKGGFVKPSALEGAKPIQNVGNYNPGKVTEALARLGVLSTSGTIMLLTRHGQNGPARRFTSTTIRFWRSSTMALITRPN